MTPNQNLLKEFHAQRINPKKNCIDFNDLVHITRVVPDEIIGWQPIGVAKGKSHFNGTFFFRRGGKKSWVFHVKPIYFVNTYGAMRPMSEAFSHHGHHKLVLRQGWENIVDFGWLVWLMKRMELIKGNVMLPMSRVPLVVNAFGGPYFPNPDVETTSVDGGVRRSTADIWANIRGGAGTNATPSDASDTVPHIATTTLSNWAPFTRAITLFDATAIPDTDVISAATESLRASNRIDNFSQSVTIVVCVPASNTNLVSADYDIANWTMTQQNTTDITLASYSTTVYNDFALNATGIGNVSKTGITKFGAVMSGDRTNTEPTYVANTDARVTTLFAETAGTADDPKLSGTSAAAAAAVTSRLALLGIGG